MSHRIHTLATVFVLFLSISLFSQVQSEEQLLHPEVQRYTNELGLSSEQTVELQSVYEETTVRGKEIDAEMTEARKAQRGTIRNATPSEKEQYRSDMNELSKERITLKTFRKERLNEILTPEQKVLLKESRAKGAND